MNVEKYDSLFFEFLILIFLFDDNVFYFFKFIYNFLVSHFNVLSTYNTINILNELCVNLKII